MRTRAPSHRALPSPAPRLALAAALVIALAATANAQNLPPGRAQRIWCAASEGSLWIVRAQADTGTIAVYLRLPTDPPGQIRPVMSLSGRLSAPGIAAAPDQLWLVFSNGSVTSLSAPIPAPTTALLTEPYVVTPLPRDRQVVSLAATRAGLWALTRQEDEALPPMQQLNEAEHTLETLPPAKPESSPPPPRASARKGSRTPQPLEQPGTRPEPPPRDQLLHLTQSRWLAFPLPADWPAGAVAQLVGDSHEDRPTLIAQNAQRQLAIFIPETDDPTTWSVTTVGPTAIESWRAVSVRRQIILAERRAEAAHLRVRLWLARPLGALPSGLTALAALDFPDLPAVAPWAVTGLSDRVAIAAWHDNRLYWSTCDLAGRPVLAAQPLTVQHPPSMLTQPDSLLVIIGLVVASMLVLYVLVRRASGAARVPPAYVAAASLAARALAALVDLAPCFAAVFPFFPKAMSSPSFDYWPGRSGTWPAMLPGAIIVGLFVLHTALSEWRWGCSLGKRVLRLHVLDASTLRPQASQILLRNLLKVLDLIVPPLLVILVVSPYRQRLGDLVAQTIVVSAKGARAPSDNPRGPRGHNP